MVDPELNPYPTRQKISGMSVPMGAASSGVMSGRSDPPANWVPRIASWSIGVAGKVHVSNWVQCHCAATPVIVVGMPMFCGVPAPISPRPMTMAHPPRGLSAEPPRV